MINFRLISLCLVSILGLGGCSSTVLSFAAGAGAGAYAYHELKKS